jgi:hypothetical protein
MRLLVRVAVLAASIAAVQGSAAQPPPPTSTALMPGFEMLPDGSTRLFVELSKPTSFDAKPSRGSVTYVLKEAHVDRRNNQNPLVTVHFNTPVTSARLVPHARDLWFVVDLRANVQPTATMESSKEGAATLRVSFPKGVYLPAPSESAAPPPSSAEP